MTAQTPAKRNMGGRLVPMKSAAAATSSRLATYSVMLMFCRSRFSRRAWRSAGVSGYVWNEAAGDCGGILGGTDAVGDGDDKGAEGDAGTGTGTVTREMLTSAGTGVAGVGTLVTAAVVRCPRGGPSPRRESASAELGDCVAPGLGWPDA
ncbi:hypothetical protein [Arthrobacter sp. 4R501]|uniref:hypothetical protein n=1 Tax=Arthrobacter sp. 4R501 TaxID=2058886 RepID=UPI0015E306A3|nr:hypothetical protein [Arthrobacter sp. 4R501]